MMEFACRNGLWLILATWSCSFHTVHCGYSVTNASNLEDAILTNYHTMVRPSELVPVYIDIGLYHISSLSNIDQELSLVGFLILQWLDERLIWTPSDYGNISATYLKNSQLWTPAITLANSADGIRLLSDDTDTETIPLYIMSKGYVVWLAAANYLVKCPVDITYYPFDSQKCSMKISTWLYGTEELVFVATEDRINLELYEENGEWDLINTGVSLGTRTLQGHAMSMAEFTLDLRRKHSYYILNMILPVVFTSMLGCLVFLLPIESGEKNGFALTILLSLSVIMTIVSDKIPPTSTHVCILSVYLLCALSISAIEVLATVFIQRIHNKAESNRFVGGKLQTFARILARIAFYTNTPSESYPADEMLSTPKLLRNSKIFPSDQEPRTDMKHKNMNQKYAEHKGNAKNKEQQNQAEEDGKSLDSVIFYDYKDISVCLDKICFYVFFLVTLIMTLTFLLIIAEGDS